MRKNQWRLEMRHEMQQLHQVLDGLGDALDTRLTALQAEMSHEFNEQKRLSLEQARFNEAQARLNEAQAKLNEAQAQINHAHHQSVSRMSASFDQTLTDLHTDLLRRIRTGSIIWGTLTERTAEMQLDIERFESTSESLTRRIEAIEKRLAG